MTAARPGYPAAPRYGRDCDYRQLDEIVFTDATVKLLMFAGCWVEDIEDMLDPPP
jgi:hypothetical protein